MKLRRTSAIAIALSLAAVANSASAETLAYGYTRPNHAGGIVAKELVGSSRGTTGDYASFAAERDQFDDITESYWIWAANDAFGVRDNNRAIYEFKFTLREPVMDTVMIEGYWGVDNYGYLSLNGVALNDTMAGVSGSELMNKTETDNFQVANYFSITGSSYFLANAENVLTFTMFDQDYDTFGDYGGNSYGAFHALVEVSAVPLPAGAVLGLSGLALLAGVGRRRRKA